MIPHLKPLEITQLANEPSSPSLRRIASVHVLRKDSFIPFKPLKPHLKPIEITSEITELANEPASPSLRRIASVHALRKEDSLATTAGLSSDNPDRWNAQGLATDDLEIEGYDQSSALNKAIKVYDLPPLEWLRGGWPFYKKLYNFETTMLVGIPPFSLVRLTCMRVTSSRRFANLVLLLIVLNAITLAMDTPENASNDGIQAVVNLTDDIFFACWATEALLKIVAMGFIAHPRAYVRNPWNVLDFIIVVEGVLRYFLASTNISAVRLVRILRPLRTISRVQGMKLIVSAVFKSFSMILDVLVLVVFLVVVFAILGLQVFSGVTHNTCVLHANQTIDGAFLNRSVFMGNNTRGCSMIYGQGRSCADNFWQPSSVLVSCEERGQNDLSLQHYDYIWNAVIAVIQIVSLDNWTDIMFPILDGLSFWWWPYFVILITLGAYFCVNLFLAVLLDEFTVLREEEQTKAEHRLQLRKQPSNSSVGETWGSPLGGGSPLYPPRRWGVSPISQRPPTSPLEEDEPQASLRESKRRCGSPIFTSAEIRTIAAIAQNKNGSCLHRLRSFFEKIVTSTKFSYFMLLVTIVNLGVLAADHNNIDPAVADVFEYINFVATLVFMTEFTVKLFTLGFTAWVADRFNVADGVLVAVSVVEMAISRGKGSALSALRTLRVLRVIMYMSSRFTSVRTVFLGILSSIQAVGYLVLLLCLLIFTYAVLGVHIFGSMTPSPDVRLADFTTLWRSMLTCFVVMTGDNWMTIAVKTADATSDVAVIYFVSLFMFGNYIIMNLFVAIIVDEFTMQQTATKLFAMWMGKYFVRTKNDSDSVGTEVFLHQACLSTGLEEGVVKHAAILAGVIVDESSFVYGIKRIETPMGNHGSPRTLWGSPRPLQARRQMRSEANASPSHLWAHRQQAHEKQASPRRFSAPTVVHKEDGGSLRRTDAFVVRGTNNKTMDDMPVIQRPRAMSVTKATVPLSFSANYRRNTRRMSTYITEFAAAGERVPRWIGGAVPRSPAAQSLGLTVPLSPNVTPCGSPIVLALPPGIQRLSLYQTIPSAVSGNSFKTQNSEVPQGITEEGSGDTPVAVHLGVTPGRTRRVTIDPTCIETLIVPSRLVSPALVDLTLTQAPPTLIVPDEDDSWGAMVPPMALDLDQKEWLCPCNDDGRMAVEAPSAFPSESKTAVRCPKCRGFVVNADALESHMLRCARKRPTCGHCLQEMVPRKWDLHLGGRCVGAVPPPRDVGVTSCPSREVPPTPDSESDSRGDTDFVQTFEDAAARARIDSIASCVSIPDSLQQPAESAADAPAAEAPVEGATTTRKLSGSRKGCRPLEMRFHGGNLLPTVRSAYERLFVSNSRRHTADRLYGTSLSFFPAEGPSRAYHVRRFCATMVTSVLFEVSMMVVIIVSLAFLWMAPELAGTIEDSADVVFVTIFLVEMILKWVAWGLCGWDGGKQNYLRATVNRCDMVVAFAGFVSLFWAPARLVRVLRVLRVVVRSRHIRTIGKALLYSIPGVSQALGFSISIWFVFSIVGVAFFKGELSRCTGPATTRANCTGTYVVQVPMAVGYRNVTHTMRWVPNEDNFDHVGNSMLLLFKVVMQEQWTDLMFQSMDATGRDTAPVKDNRSAAALYFVIFVVVGKFFGANMVVGTLLNSFVNMKGHIDGSALLTPLQRMWVKSRRVARATELSARAVPPLPVLFSKKGPKPHLASWYQFRRIPAKFECELCGEPHSMRPEGPFTEAEYDAHAKTYSHYVWYAVRRTRTVMFHLCETNKQRFDLVVTVLIIMNVCVLAMQHYRMTDTWGEVLLWLNIGFLVLFGIEVSIKLIAVGPNMFILNMWNRFDVAMLIISVIAFSFGTNTAMFRVIRMFRLFRLFNKLQGLQTVSECLLLSLPSFANVAFLLFVTFFVFGVLAVELFGHVRQTGLDGLHQYANFETTGMAMLTLFQASTTEGWPQIMAGCKNPDNGGSEAAVPFFVIFMIVGSFIMVNLIIAVVLENFIETQDAIAMHSLATPLEEFKILWLDFDPLATKTLPTMKFIIILRAWLHEYGVFINTSYTQFGFVDIMNFLEALAIPINFRDDVVDGKMVTTEVVEYKDAISSLFRVMFNIDLSHIVETARATNHKRLGRIAVTDCASDITWDVRHSFAQQRIARNWRTKKLLRLVRLKLSATTEMDFMTLSGELPPDREEDNIQHMLDGRRLSAVLMTRLQRRASSRALEFHGRQAANLEFHVNEPMFEDSQQRAAFDETPMRHIHLDVDAHDAESDDDDESAVGLGEPIRF